MFDDLEQALTDFDKSKQAYIDVFMIYENHYRKYVVKSSGDIDSNGLKLENG